MPRDSFMAVPAEAWDRIFGNKEKVIKFDVNKALRELASLLCENERKAKERRQEETELREGCKYDVCDCAHCNPGCDRTEPEDDCD